MNILLTFLFLGLAVYTFQITFRGFLDLWSATYDDITASCSRTEHFFPKYPSAGPLPLLDQLWNERRRVAVSPYAGRS